MSDVKNIVIIGASAAGHNVANGIADSLPENYRVIIVERNTYVVWSPATVRQIVVPGWEDKNFEVEVKQERFFRAGSRHQVLSPNSVVELKKNSVVLEKPFEGSTELTFEKCVIATGAQQPPPIGAQPGSSIEDFKAHLREMQQAFKKAQKILIVGGGTVGVEVTGELTTEYPGKAITIVHDDPAGLLGPTPRSKPEDQFYQAPTYSKLSVSLEKQLAARNVDVIIGDLVELPQGLKSGSLDKLTTFKTKSGKEVEADCVFVSIGNRANSQIVKAADPGALSEVQSRILVDEFFRVQASSDDSPLSGEYYALGDVCANADWKTVVCVMNQAPALAKIILAEIKGNTPTAYTTSPQTAICVPLGTQGGAGVIPVCGWFEIPMPGFIMGMKSKDFFSNKSFFSRFQGDEKLAFSG